MHASIVSLLGIGLTEGAPDFSLALKLLYMLQPLTKVLIAARCTRFISSRTLPGQLKRFIAALASPLKPRAQVLRWLRKVCRK